MASVENTVMIRRSIEEVVGFLADFENIPTWNYAISETRKVSQGPRAPAFSRYVRLVR